MKKNGSKKDFSPNSSILIDNIKVNTYKEEISVCNDLEVEVGTTGHMGGDTGHGGRTYFRLSNLGSTDMRCAVSGHTPGKGKIDAEIDDVSSIEISFGGDSELDTFCEALKIGYNVLSGHAYSIESYYPTLLEQRRMRFSSYLNELCELYRKNRNLRGMNEIRNKYHITAITKQQFYECNLNDASGYIDSDFCNKVYDYILDNTKSSPAPKYHKK